MWLSNICIFVEFYSLCIFVCFYRTGWPRVCGVPCVGHSIHAPDIHSLMPCARLSVCVRIDEVVGFYTLFRSMFVSQFSGV